MSYKPPRQRHYMVVTGLFTGDRYVKCDKCPRVLRAWDMKPLIHNGKKP